MSNVTQCNGPNCGKLATNVDGWYALDLPKPKEPDNNEDRDFAAEYDARHKDFCSLECLKDFLA